MYDIKCQGMEGQCPACPIGRAVAERFSNALVTHGFNDGFDLDGSGAYCVCVEKYYNDIRLTVFATTFFTFRKAEFHSLRPRKPIHGRSLR